MRKLFNWGKHLTFLSVALLSVFSISGCSGGGDSSTDDNTMTIKELRSGNSHFDIKGVPVYFTIKAVPGTGEITNDGKMLANAEGIMYVDGETYDIEINYTITTDDGTPEAPGTGEIVSALLIVEMHSGIKPILDTKALQLAIACITNPADSVVYYPDKIEFNFFYAGPEAGFVIQTSYNDFEGGDLGIETRPFLVLKNR